MADRIARFFAGVTRLTEWLDDHMWGLFDGLMWHSIFYFPQRFYSRLDCYGQESPDVQRIRWRRQRYRPDSVKVWLTGSQSPDRLRQMAREISDRLEDGYLSIVFLLGQEVVASCCMCNGKFRSPAAQHHSLVTDLLNLPSTD